MKPKPDIDVVIPVYNGEKFIEKAILSVLNQTYKPKFLIIVDDGSIDKTHEVIRNIKSNEVEIKYVYKKNGGPSSARNRGIKMAKSEYLAFLDADDVWKRDKLKKQIEKFKTSDVKNLGVVYCRYSWIDENGNPLDYNTSYKLDKNIRGNVYKYLLDGNKIAGSDSAVLIKRRCFQKAGLFDERLQSCEDWDMWLRISKSFSFDYVYEDLVKLRRHKSNQQNNKEAMFIGLAIFFSKLMDGNEVSSKTIKFFRYQLLREFVKQFPDLSSIKQLKDNISADADKVLFGDKVYLARCLFNIVIIDNTLLRFKKFLFKSIRNYG